MEVNPPTGDIIWDTDIQQEGQPWKRVPLDEAWRWQWTANWTQGCNRTLNRKGWWSLGMQQIKQSHITELGGFCRILLQPTAGLRQTRVLNTPEFGNPLAAHLWPHFLRVNMPLTRNGDSRGHYQWNKGSNMGSHFHPRRCKRPPFSPKHTHILGVPSIYPAARAYLLGKVSRSAAVFSSCHIQSPLLVELWI